MSNPNAHNAACDIEDMAIKASAKVDHAEMYPDSSVSFQEIRLMLKAIKEEAQYIQSLTRPQKSSLCHPQKNSGNNTGKKNYRTKRRKTRNLDCPAAPDFRIFDKYL
jgi:hypothetical protein